MTRSRSVLSIYRRQALLGDAVLMAIGTLIRQREALGIVRILSTLLAWKVALEKSQSIYYDNVLLVK